MVTKDSTPHMQSRSATTPPGEESLTPVTRPSSLEELSASMAIESNRKPEAIQRAQVSSLMGPNRTKEPLEKMPNNQSPSLAARPKKYALELWLEIKTSAGVYSTPEEDSYSVDFAIDILNHAYPGCTGLYLDVAGHMLAFYGKKTNPRAGLLHDQGIKASRAISNIPTWMGYFARLRVGCVSIFEASDILAGCKRLEKESLRRAHWDLQHRFSSMQVHHPLSPTARPFQPGAASSSTLVDHAAHDLPARDGSRRSGPPRGSTRGLPTREATSNHHDTSDDDGVSSDTSIPERPPSRRCRGHGSRSSQSGSDSDGTHSSGGRQKKKDGFLSKIQIPEFGSKKGHPHDVADAFRQWAHCITYYRDYYEDSYLMPLVVSSLKGDASDVFNWTLSVSPGDAQDLSELLQMLREHYCGSLTFREQRNMVKNLCQGAREDAIDFMIRVGSSMGNLAKDWKGRIEIPPI